MTLTPYSSPMRSSRRPSLQRRSCGGAEGEPEVLAPLTAAAVEPPPPIGVDEINRLLARAYKRAEELEDVLVEVLTPVRERAATRAAREFSRQATDYLNAAGKKGEPPSWSAPPADSLLDVDALAGELRSRTQPVREAMVKTMHDGLFCESDPEPAARRRSHHRPPCRLSGSASTSGRRREANS